MKHRVAGKKLSRNRSERKALFKSLVNGLVIHGQIKTTETKAKAIMGLADKLITRGKSGTLQARRIINAFLQNKIAVRKIVDELSPLFKARPGGFTRMIRLGRRKGDGTMLVKLELVEKPQEKEEPKSKAKEPDKTARQVATAKK